MDINTGVSFRDNHFENYDALFNLGSHRGAGNTLLYHCSRRNHLEGVTRGSSSWLPVAMTEIASFVSGRWLRTASLHCHRQKHKAEACCCFKAWIQREARFYSLGNRAKEKEDRAREHTVREKGIKEERQFTAKEK